jgi:hypothetical protein
MLPSSTEYLNTSLEKRAKNLVGGSSGTDSARLGLTDGDFIYMHIYFASLWSFVIRF